MIAAGAFTLAAALLLAAAASVRLVLWADDRARGRGNARPTTTGRRPGCPG